MIGLNVEPGHQTCRKRLYIGFLKNALIYSDNIYFAKAALKIGENDMESSLTKLGFNDVLPFDIKMAKSQFSNTEKIEKEVQLADSGYGQGQILVNPSFP